MNFHMKICSVGGTREFETDPLPKSGTMNEKLGQGDKPNHIKIGTKFMLITMINSEHFLPDMDYPTSLSHSRNKCINSQSVCRELARETIEKMKKLFKKKGVIIWKWIGFLKKNKQKKNDEAQIKD